MKIIFITFGIELVGAMLLFGDFSNIYGDSLTAVFYSIFHSVSAFCNAGFALFTDSLESFKSNISMNFIIAALVITGGISFSVIFNLIENFKTNVDNLVKRQNWLNSKNILAIIDFTGIG